MPDFSDDVGFDTLAIRAGQSRTNEGEHSEPIFTTSSYVFASAAEAAARFSGEQPGNIYSRFTNPTVRTFEQRLAALEGAGLFEIERDAQGKARSYTLPNERWSHPDLAQLEMDKAFYPGTLVELAS